MKFYATCTKSYAMPRNGHLASDENRWPICEFRAIRVTNEEDVSKYNSRGQRGEEDRPGQMLSVRDPRVRAGQENLCERPCR